MVVAADTYTGHEQRGVKSLSEERLGLADRIFNTEPGQEFKFRENDLDTPIAHGIAWRDAVGALIKENILGVASPGASEGSPIEELNSGSVFVKRQRGFNHAIRPGTDTGDTNLRWITMRTSLAVAAKQHEALRKLSFAEPTERDECIAIAMSETLTFHSIRGRHAGLIDTLDVDALNRSFSQAINHHLFGGDGKITSKSDIMDRKDVMAEDTYAQYLKAIGVPYNRGDTIPEHPADAYRLFVFGALFTLSTRTNLLEAVRAPNATEQPA